MIPFVDPPQWQLGPVTIAAFGVIVAAAVVIGLVVGQRRFRAAGLDAQLGETFSWWVIVGGFVGAHVFSVVFYFPREVAENPLILVQFWKDISSFGGMVGGVAAMALFMRCRGRSLAPAARWDFVEVVAFVFPISLMVGRLACAIAHDHPGTLTRFPLAVSLRTTTAQAYITRVYEAAGRAAELPPRSDLATLGFHDLGWYEFLYLGVVVVPVTIYLARREQRVGRHRRGTYLLSFVGLYMPVRFALDFLRVSDARYAALTPGQWAALVVLAMVPWLVVRARAVC